MLFKKLNRGIEIYKCNKRIKIKDEKSEIKVKQHPPNKKKIK